MWRPIKVFDFFAGCGGASRGFQDAGMEIVYGLDCDADAAASLRQNVPGARVDTGDIRQSNAQELRGLVEQQRPHPVLFSGCPPCQPFTKQNTQRPAPSADVRRPLLLEFLRLIQACKPDVVVMENVPGVAASASPLKAFVRGLAAAGYGKPAHGVMSLKQYGVPQTRRRYLLIASRQRSMDLPAPTHGPGTGNTDFATVRDWIGGLPGLAAGETHPTIPDHNAAGVSARNRERLQATPEGGGNRDWPPHLQLDCHRGASGFTDVYGRLAWDRPAPALTTRCISYSNGRFGHPEQDRALSVREAACLQTFPMDYRFTGSMASRARQIGNALPVRAAEVMGRHIRDSALSQRIAAADRAVQNWSTAPQCAV